MSLAFVAARTVANIQTEPRPAGTLRPRLSALPACPPGAGADMRSEDSRLWFEKSRLTWSPGAERVCASRNLRDQRHNLVQTSSPTQDPDAQHQLRYVCQHFESRQAEGHSGE